jgi:flagellar hook-length control protein FliK
VVSDLAATVAAHLTAAAPAAFAAAMNLRPKSKPQIAISADKSAGAVQARSDDTAPDFKASEQALHALFSRVNLVESTGVRPSVSGSSADSAGHATKASSGIDAVSQDTTSVARKGVGTSTALAGDHDLGAGFASAINAHATSFQPSVPQAAETPISAAAQAAPTAWVPPSVHLAQNTPPASDHRSQPDAPPDPPRMVDSGQLRVHQNSSELKISVQVPELGKVEVRAVSVHDVTTAHLTTSQHDALQVLGAERATLEQALKSHGVILGSLDTHGQGQSGEGQRQPAHSSQSQTPSFRGTSSAMATAASTSEEAVPIGVLQDYSSINVHA